MTRRTAASTARTPRARGRSTPGTARPTRSARSPTGPTAPGWAASTRPASGSGGSPTPTAMSSACGGASRSAEAPTPRPRWSRRTRPGSRSAPAAWPSSAVRPRAARPSTGARPARTSRVLYSHDEDAYIIDLSEDESLVAINHSEHGDSRHMALRVVRAGRLDRGRPVGRSGQGPGRGRASPRSPATSGCWSCTSAAAVPSRSSGTRRAVECGRSSWTFPARSAPTGTPTPPRCSSRTPTTPATSCTATTSPAATLAQIETPRGVIGCGHRAPGRHGGVLLVLVGLAAGDPLDLGRRGADPAGPSPRRRPCRSRTPG